MGQIRDIATDIKKIDTIEVNVSQLQSTQPTAVSQLTNDSGYQTLTQVNNAISALVNSAPSTLNTLNELAAALGNDANFATTVTTSLAGKANQSTTYTKTEVDSALTSKVSLTGGSLTGTLGVPRINVNGAPDSETVENNGRFSSRHLTYPAYLFKDSVGNTKGEAYFGIGGGDLTIINYAANGSIRLVTNGAETIRGDSVGRVFLPNQPRFVASSSIGATTYGATEPIIMNVSTINVGNSYNSSNGYFTAPVSGFYSFKFSLYSYNTAQFVVLKNGSQYMPTGATDVLLTTIGASEINGLSWDMQLAAGDYVGFAFRAGHSGSVYRPHGQFSGYLVG